MDMDIKTDLQCKSLVIVLAIVLKKPCLMKKFLHFHVVYGGIQCLRRQEEVGRWSKKDQILST